MMKQLNVPYALDKNQQLIEPSEAIKGELYFCPACGDTLITRQGDVRIYHFSHRTTNVCTQETIIHRTAKKLLCETIDNWKNHGGPVPMVERYCSSCGIRLEQPLPDKVERGQEEFPIGDFRGDVVLFANGSPTAVIEVYVTHAVEEKKSNKLPLPFIELSGEDVINDPINWEPIEDKFKPLKCKDCLGQEKKTRERSGIVSKMTGILIPHEYYLPGVVECWKCHKEILVFSWPEHDSYTKGPPKGKPIPKTIKFKHIQSSGKSYWVNTCPFCHVVQGDFYLYSERDGPFFGLKSDED